MPWGHIENEDAYERARTARIQNNRRITGRRKLEAAIAQDSPEFKFWLLSTVELPGDGDDTPVLSTAEEQDRFYRQYGRPPGFILTSLANWGGLTDGQLACARKVWAEKQGRVTERTQQDAARAANAPAWREGRQEVEGTVKTVKVQEFNVGYGRATTQYKALLEMADGRLLWTSLPSVLIDFDEPMNLRGHKVAMTVAVKPKLEDKTFGFGSRPTKARRVE